MRLISPSSLVAGRYQRRNSVGNLPAELAAVAVMRSAMLLRTISLATMTPSRICSSSALLAVSLRTLTMFSWHALNSLICASNSARWSRSSLLSASMSSSAWAIRWIVG